MSTDILYKKDSEIFSYRVAGVFIHDGKVLLQKPSDDDGYALPGGHTTFGEVSADALIRELKEELNADFKTVELLTVGEIFFPFNNSDCHQICLYYSLSAVDISQIPLENKFQSIEKIKGHSLVDFYWIPLNELDEIKLYVPSIIPYIKNVAKSKPSNKLPRVFLHKE